MRSVAEALAARLPPLMVNADRVAATVAQGVHGRRRIGTGDSFWQFRPFVTGDAVSRIDWRQSAKSDRAYVRDMEWEAAQTICLWRDASPSMAWRSARALPEKRERAELLLLALASLLTRAGEQIRLLIGDFLLPLDEFRACIARLAETPVRGQVLMLLDPAEASLPYEGRVKFRGLEGEADSVVPRVQGVRQAYGAAMARQQAGLASICAAAGFGFAVHRTDQPPEHALLALWMALDANAARARGRARSPMTTGAG
jgi:uncharacterized protein (DUF58 family)